MSTPARVVSDTKETERNDESRVFEGGIGLDAADRVNRQDVICRMGGSQVAKSVSSVHPEWNGEPFPDAEHLRLRDVLCRF